MFCMGCHVVVCTVETLQHLTEMVIVMVEILDGRVGERSVERVKNAINYLLH